MIWYGENATNLYSDKFETVFETVLNTKCKSHLSNTQAQLNQKITQFVARSFNILCPLLD